MSAQSRRAVFLDRDGTIIRDTGYLGDLDGIEFLPGAVEAMRSLHDAGYLLVVITNQSGVARGLFDEDRCRAVSERFVSLLAEEGVPVAASFYCPHLPGAAVPEYDKVCDCRKPGRGLFEKAAEELHVDFNSSWAAGDSLRDLEPAKKLGAKTILVLTGKGSKQAGQDGALEIADVICDDLVGAAREILARTP